MEKNIQDQAKKIDVGFRIWGHRFETTKGFSISESPRMQALALLIECFEKAVKERHAKDGEQRAQFNHLTISSGNLVVEKHLSVEGRLYEFKYQPKSREKSETELRQNIFARTIKLYEKALAKQLAS